MVPGMLDHAGYWADLDSFLDAVGVGTTRNGNAVSLRGRGGSSAPETGWTADDHVSDIASVVSHLGIERAVLVGWSAGGFYAAGEGQRLVRPPLRPCGRLDGCREDLLSERSDPAARTPLLQRQLRSHRVPLGVARPGPRKVRTRKFRTEACGNRACEPDRTGGRACSKASTRSSAPGHEILAPLRCS